MFHSSKFVGLMGGLADSREMNTLEVEFLETVNWRVCLSSSSFKYYQQGVHAMFSEAATIPPLMLLIRENTSNFINLTCGG
jgi:hypothetical protein